MKNLSAIAALLLLGGCSLVNSFADLKPQASDGGTGGGGGAGGVKNTGGSAGTGKGGAGGALPEAGVGGSQIDASTGGESNSGGASSGGASSGGAGSGGAPDEDQFVPGGPGGAIVVYQSTKAPAESVVWVLNPASGAELSKTNTPNVAAVLNDPNTDNWYWFETTGPTAPTATLYVRALSLPSGRWRNVGAGLIVPAPLGPVSLLNGGIAYVSGNDGVVTILNTANQSKVSVFANVELDAEASPNAVLDGSSRLGLIPHASAKGGTLTVVLEEPSASCVAVGTNTLCNIDLLRVNVDFTAGPGGATVDTSAPVTVGRVNQEGGNPGFAADNANDADIIILPPEDGSASGTTNTACTTVPAATMGKVQEYNPNQQHVATAQGPFSFVMGSTRVSGAAFDYCQNIVYATSLIDTVIWGVPTSGNPPPPTGQICRTLAGGTLLYEPYTHSVFRIANDSSLESYTVTGSPSAAPAFKVNSNFHTPSGFSAISGVIAVRTGSPVNADSPQCGP